MKLVMNLICVCILGLAVAMGCGPLQTDAALGTALDPLSVQATAYTVTAQNAPPTGTACNDPSSSSWCKCGTDYTDNAARCNTATEVLMVHVPAPGCQVSSAVLSYQASLWNGGTSVSIRRIMRPVTQPTMGVAGLCASTSQASWYRSGPEAWTTPGAAGDGTDRTASGPSRALASGGVRTESFDVAALVNGCPTTGDCVLAQFNAGAHVNVLPGTVALVYECAGPQTVCGDGLMEGAEGCDDGGQAAGDGCSPACAVEAGYACAGSPSQCSTTCGDGVKAGVEACDDGNLTSHDGCSVLCTAEQCVWQ